MSNRFLAILILFGFLGAGYLYYNIKYLPEKNAKVQEEVELQKQLVEEKKEPKLVKQNTEKIILTKAQKIEQIKQNKGNYRTFKLKNNKKAYFKKDNNRLNLYLEDKKIGNFDLVDKQYLKVDLIFGTESELYIEIGKDKFYYNDITKIVSKIDFNMDIDYVKKGSNNKLIIVTVKGSFVYNTYNKSLEYFSYFNDFIYSYNGYIGLVRKKDKRILNNLGFESKNKNLVVYYNSDSKKKKIIYETDIDIDKLYMRNNILYLVDIEGEIYNLENF